jgi:hypothetical protein
VRFDLAKLEPESPGLERLDLVALDPARSAPPTALAA